MPRRRYIFDPPDRFITGTVGDPGDRTFFLQAREGGRVVSVILEKVQVAVLAERLNELLGELERRGIDSPPTAPAPNPANPTTPATSATTSSDPPAEAAGASNEDTGPLDEPLVEAFRAGSLTLGWDEDADLVLVEARAQDEDGEGVDPDDDDDEDEDGPDLLRVRMTAAEARAFVARAARVVAGGRPPCPLCGAPLDPHGHICPRRNGHYVN